MLLRMLRPAHNSLAHAREKLSAPGGHGICHHICVDQSCLPLNGRTHLPIRLKNYRRRW